MAALAAVLLYLLSIGPACWLTSRLEAGEIAISAIYRPVTWLILENDACNAALSWYSEIGSADGWAWTFDGAWRSSGWLLSPKARAIMRDLEVD
jgi:hypothetical protein